MGGRLIRLLFRLVGDPKVPHGTEIRRVVFAVNPPSSWSKISTYTLIRLLARLVEDPEVPHVAEIRMVVFAVKPHCKWPKFQHTK